MHIDVSVSLSTSYPEDTQETWMWGRGAGGATERQRPTQGERTHRDWREMGEEGSGNRNRQDRRMKETFIPNGRHFACF